MSKVLTESGMELDSSKTEIKKSNDPSCLSVVKGIPCSVLDEKTVNGRIYPSDEMQRAIDRLRKSGAFESRKLICSSDDHPENALVPKPIHASHVVVDAYIRKENGRSIFYNDWIILPTFNGQQLQSLIESRVTLGTSIRGYGKVDDAGYVRDYEYFGTDVVGLPSANTFVRLGEGAKTGKNVLIEKMEINKRVSRSIIEMSREIADLKRKLHSFADYGRDEEGLGSDQLYALTRIISALKRPNLVTYKSPIERRDQQRNEYDKKEK